MYFWLFEDLPLHEFFATNLVEGPANRVTVYARHWSQRTTTESRLQCLLTVLLKCVTLVLNNLYIKCYCLIFLLWCCISCFHIWTAQDMWYLNHLIIIFYGLRIIKLFFMLITILVIWLIKSWSYIQVLISLKDNRNWFIQFTKLFNLTIIVIICINSFWKVLEVYIALSSLVNKLSIRSTI